MCNQNGVGGCFGSIAWLLLGVGIGARCQGGRGNRPRRPALNACRQNRCGEEIDCYYARQYALYPFDGRCGCGCGGTPSGVAGGETTGNTFCGCGRLF